MINHKKLVENYKAVHTKKGVGDAKKVLREMFEPEGSGGTPALDPHEVNLGELFIECFGWHEFNACKRGDRLANDVMRERLVEEGGAVSTAAFQNISGQIVYSFILEAYNLPEFVVSKLIPEQQSSFVREKVAGISNIGDKAAVRKEGDPFALAGVGENWINTATTVERGLTVPITAEAIFFDRTGEVPDRCRYVGEFLGLNKEKRAIDCLADLNVTDHRYNWRDTVYGSYQASTPWVNLKTSNPIADYTALQQLEILLSKMTDPFTGEPILFTPTHILFAEDIRHNVLQVLRAREFKTAVGGYAASGNLVSRYSPNTLASYTPVTSQLIGARFDAASEPRTSFYLGAPAKYAKYLYNWPLTVRQAPPNNLDEFHRRIILQHNAFERGAYTVIEPRCVAKSQA